MPLGRRDPPKPHAADARPVVGADIVARCKSCSRRHPGLATCFPCSRSRPRCAIGAMTSSGLQRPKRTPRSSKRDLPRSLRASPGRLVSPSTTHGCRPGQTSRHRCRRHGGAGGRPVHARPTARTHPRDRLRSPELSAPRRVAGRCPMPARGHCSAPCPTACRRCVFLRQLTNCGTHAPYKTLVPECASSRTS